MSYFGDFLDNKKNNFDFMRIVAAILVLFSHSYPLTGMNGNEPLIMLTNGQISFGTLGVYIFFIISGFLISHSFNKRNSIKMFLKARFLRIFPALFVVTILATFIIGPSITDYTFSFYWNDEKTWYYLRNIFILWIKTSLPGVFTTNPYPNVVNGSLWTIPLEFKSYLVLAFVGSIGFFKHGFLLILLFICSLFYTDNQFAQYFKYFSIGMVFYHYRFTIPLNKYIFFASICVIYLSGYLCLLNSILPLFGAYIILYICLNTSIPLTSFGKYGDFSYGTYIYAFLVQQLVVYYGGSMTPFENFSLSLPITLICAYISWHFIENPCLKLKQNMFLKQTARF